MICGAPMARKVGHHTILPLSDTFSEHCQARPATPLRCLHGAARGAHLFKALPGKALAGGGQGRVRRAPRREVSQAGNGQSGDGCQHGAIEGWQGHASWCGHLHRAAAPLLCHVVQLKSNCWLCMGAPSWEHAAKRALRDLLMNNLSHIQTHAPAVCAQAAAMKPPPLELLASSVAG